MKKLKTLSNYDIDAYYGDEPKYGGTYAKNALPYDTIQKDKFYIINLDDDDGMGTHWTCVLHNDGSVFYFDSCGGPPSIQILSFTKKYKNNRIYNLLQLQNLNSNLCGYYCLYVIHMMVFNKLKFLDVLNNFTTNTEYNDDVITKYFSGNKQIQGTGIFTDIVSRIFRTAPRNEFPPSVRELIKQFGEQQIAAITVCRTPVVSMLQKLMNFLSFGQLQQRLKQYNYDTLYHLYLLIRLNNGTVFRLEKNHVINMVITQPTMNKFMECRGVNISQSVTLNTFLLNGISFMGNRFVVYDSIRANCQDFVASLLQANKYITDFNFIKQNTDDLIPKYLEYLNRFVTDTASRGDVLINGRSIIV